VLEDRLRADGGGCSGDAGGGLAAGDIDGDGPFSRHPDLRRDDPAEAALDLIEVLEGECLWVKVDLAPRRQVAAQQFPAVRQQRERARFVGLGPVLRADQDELPESAVRCDGAEQLLPGPARAMQGRDVRDKDLALERAGHRWLAMSPGADGGKISGGRKLKRP